MNASPRTSRPPRSRRRSNSMSEIQQFYYREARLKDRQQYRAWMDLLTDDIHYWMPARTSATARTSARRPFMRAPTTTTTSTTSTGA